MRTFIQSSIGDIQGNIRALDAKIMATIFILLVPLTEFDLLRRMVLDMICSHTWFGIIWAAITIIVWLSACIFSFLSLIGIDNPSSHIRGSDELEGIYHGSGLFKFKKRWARKVTSELRFNDHVERFKLDEEGFTRELIFEQMKLIYIRDLKFKRHRIALRSLFILVLLGFAMYINLII